MSAAVLVALASAPAVAQQVIYPAKGQSAEQQQKDEAECYAFAKGRRVMTGGKHPVRVSATAAT